MQAHAWFSEIPHQIQTVQGLKGRLKETQQSETQVDPPIGRHRSEEVREEILVAEVVAGGEDADEGDTGGAQHGGGSKGLWAVEGPDHTDHVVGRLDGRVRGVNCNPMRLKSKI